MRRKTVFTGIVLTLAVCFAGCGAQEGQEQESAGQGQEMTEEELEEEGDRIRGIYDVESQSAIREGLDAEKREKAYTSDDMLVEYNPFGTNTQSLYVYFQTDVPVSVSCTVHVEDESIPDYTQQLTEDSSYLLEHEYQVIGLVPDMENEITFALTGTDGQTEEQTITYEMGSLMGQEEVQLETEEGNSVEDVVVRLNVTDGTVDEVLDLGDLFGAYKETCVENSDGDLDWMHINTIQWMGDGQVLFSSRETSSIIKIKDLYSTPAVEYMISDPAVWADTEWADLVLEKSGDFASQGGQHSITYVKDESLPEGQYYLYMFNNNIGVSETRPDFDWSVIDGIQSEAVDGTTSYYYKYLVDETSGSYELVESFELPYSGYVSSVQEIGDNVVADSGMQGIWGEYDSENNLIRSFTMEKESFIYRVYKYEL
ncbi:aryl-sulfate sulfotransferase [Lachnospiraceae bacterium DSM 108991]|uniref:Aryl-sulfate sulfotransferase n=1 Tax=Claveliimonas monacensis TaxID=2779351 RepID=A0ABR9RI32_9FIRM|nr:aryl-sulfate sulfotransferase [Claveliimonas monacensis]MBE5062624.1 aryl-sulfate sulfotransferase [Claveliimonas monacensis]